MVFLTLVQMGYILSIVFSEKKLCFFINEVTNTLVKHGFNVGVLAFVKDERNIFSTMTFALTSIVCHEM